MAVTIECSTAFDITPTAIRGRIHTLTLPITDALGNTITDLQQLNRARNQQRNFETLVQIISLRTLPERITDPQRHGSTWHFQFDVPHIESVAWGMDPVGALRYDADNVPMILGLDESPGTDARIHVYGQLSNCWFKVLQHK